MASGMDQETDRNGRPPGRQVAGLPVEGTGNQAKPSQPPATTLAHRSPRHL